VVVALVALVIIIITRTAVVVVVVVALTQRLPLPDLQTELTIIMSSDRGGMAFQTVVVIVAVSQLSTIMQLI